MSTRILGTAAAVAVALGLTACADQPTRTTVTSYPSGAPVYSQPGYVAPAPYVEYGRVSNIEVLTTEHRAQHSTGGLLIGAVIGGLVGNAIGGKGFSGDVATVGGAVAGGAIGNEVGRNNAPRAVSQQFRVSIQVDNGAVRYYQVDTPQNLRVGDRVRVEGGQIYRI